MFRIVILAVFLVCSSLPAFAAFNSGHHPGPPSHHQPERQREYPVDISANHGGHVSPAGRVHVREGDSLNISIRPDRGFVVRRVVVDGRDIGPVHGHHFPNVRRAHSVYVEFAPVGPPHRPDPRRFR